MAAAVARNSYTYYTGGYHARIRNASYEFLRSSNTLMTFLDTLVPNSAKNSCQ
jgi:hypothetical protein